MTRKVECGTRETLAVSKCVCGTVARVVYSRLFPDRTRPQTGRLNKSPQAAHAFANRSNERDNKCFVRSAVFACFVFSLALAAVSPGYDRTSAARRQSNPAKKQPNIIWLVLDDAGPTLGCYGDPQAITPNMDRLAREGVRFTRAFTHAPVCAPSRSGLVTGMYPTTIGSHHMRSKPYFSPCRFATNCMAGRG